MKKIIGLMIISLAFVVSVSAQKRNVSLTADTAKAETIYFEPSYSISYVGVTEYSGVVGFQFTKTDVADSCSVLTLQGSYDGTYYINITESSGYLSNTTTDGNYFLYDANPEYLKYRLKATTATGDTVRFSNVRFIYKEAN